MYFCLLSWEQPTRIVVGIFQFSISPSHNSKLFPWDQQKTREGLSARVNKKVIFRHINNYMALGVLSIASFLYWQVYNKNCKENRIIFLPTSKSGTSILVTEISFWLGSVINILRLKYLLPKKHRILLFFFLINSS